MTVSPTPFRSYYPQIGGSILAGEFKKMADALKELVVFIIILALVATVVAGAFWFVSVLPAQNSAQTTQNSVQVLQQPQNSGQPQVPPDSGQQPIGNNTCQDLCDQSYRQCQAACPKQLSHSQCRDDCETTKGQCLEKCGS